MEIIVGHETHTVHIATYQDGTGNTAIQTFDSEGIPFCRLTTNPGFPLPEGIIAVRDDQEMILGETRTALIEAGIIEQIEPLQHIPIGYTSATLYRVITP